MPTVQVYSLYKLTCSEGVEGEGPVEALPLEDGLHDVVVGTVEPEAVVPEPLPQDGVTLWKYT